MQLYQLTYLISPELKESEIKDFSQKIDSLISKNGEILKSENPKKINLAYPVEKRNEAFLATSKFSAEPQKIESLKKEFKKEKKILRFLLIKKKGIEKIEKPKTTTRPPHPPAEGGPLKEGKPVPEKKVELKKIGEKLEKILEE